jgi:aspartyl-tRNA(Asn)/glutamyl-tRNA(Gln) amidotransferase subunit C
MSPPDSAHDALDLQSVRHVAKLARLRVADEDLERYRGQLSSILGHISKLNAIAVDDVEPMAHPLTINNRLAADEPTDPMPIADLLRNAPATEDRYLAVPKVLAEGSGG